MTDAAVMESWRADARSGDLTHAGPRPSPRAAPVALTPAQVAQFDSEGFLLPFSGLSTVEARKARRNVEALEESEGTGGNGLFTNAHVTRDWFHALATKREILDVVEDLLGPDIMIWKCGARTQQLCSRCGCKIAPRLF
jgi:hypothetical protein